MATGAKGASRATGATGATGATSAKDSYESYQKDLLSTSPYGYNDSKRGGSGDYEDYQKMQISEMEKQAELLYSGGYLTHTEYNDIIEGKWGERGNRNIIQKFMFDLPTHIAGSLGANVYEDDGETLINEGHLGDGGTLETMFDMLSLPNRFMASITHAMLEGASGGAEDYYVKNKDGSISLKTDSDESFFKEQSDHGPLKFGFSVSAFARGWNSRTDYVSLSDKHDLFSSLEGEQLSPYEIAAAVQKGEMTPIEGTKQTLDPRQVWQSLENPTKNFVGGLALDITMDPTTYLTFGIKAGAKGVVTPAMRALAKKGTRIAAHNVGDPVTLTQYGTRLYNIMAEQLVPEFNKNQKVLSEAGLITDEFNTGKHLLDGKVPVAWHQRIMEGMVENYDQLAEEASRRLNQGKVRKLTHGVETIKDNAGSFGPTLKKYIGHNVDDIFQETSPFYKKEIAYDTTKLQNRLSKLPFVGKAAKFTFDKFDAGWDQPSEVVSQFRASKRIIEREYDTALDKYGKALTRLKSDDLDTVTTVLEDWGRFDDFGEASLGIATKYGDDVMEAVRFARSEFDDILNTEHAANFQTGTVTGYVSHIIDPRIRKMYIQTIAKNGEEALYSANKFTQQRMIASIAEGEEIFGEGSLKTNIFEILAARKKASLNMIHQTRLYSWVAHNYSIPEMIILSSMQAGNRTNPLIRGWMRRNAYGNEQIVNVDQVYEWKHGNLSKLGFPVLESVDDKETLAKTTDYLEYLMREVGEGVGDNGMARKSHPDGLAHAERVGANEAAKMHSFDFTRGSAKIAGVEQDLVYGKAMPRTFKYKVRGPRKVKQKLKSFDVIESMKMLADPKHPGWRVVLGENTSNVRVSIDGAVDWLEGLHKYTLEHLDSQLVGFLPNVENAVLDAMRYWSSGAMDIGPTIRSVFNLKFSEDEAIAELTKAVSKFASPKLMYKATPTIPQVLVDLGRSTREAAGILTDTLKPHILTKRAIRDSAAKLGFEPEQLTELTRIMFNKDNVESQREAEVLLEVFDSIVDPMRLRAYGLKKGKNGVIYSGPSDVKASTLFGDSNKVVAKSIIINRKTKLNILPDALDRNNAIPVKGELPVKGSRARTAIDTAEELDIGEGIIPAPNFEVLDTVIGTGKLKELQEVVEVAKKAGLDEEVEAAQAAFDTEILRLRKLAALRNTGKVLPHKLLNREIDNNVKKVDKIEESLKKAFSKLPDIKPTLKLRNDMSSLRKFKNAEQTVRLASVQKAKTRLRTTEEVAKAQAKIDSVMQDIENIISEGIVDKDILTFVKKKVFERDLEFINRKVTDKLRTLKKTWNTEKHQDIWKKYNKEKPKIIKLHKNLTDTKTNIDLLRKKLQKLPKTESKGVIGLVGDPKVDDFLTPSEELLRASKAYAYLKRDKAAPDVLAAAKLRLENARSNMEKLVVSGSRADEFLNSPAASGLRQFADRIELKFYMPESMAKYLDDATAPLIDATKEEGSKFYTNLNHVLRSMDKIQTYYKANLLLPWSGTWGRNAFSNVMMNYFAHGLQIFNPTKAARLFHLHNYVMLRDTDIGRYISGDSDKVQKYIDWVKAKTWTANNGRTMTTDELIEHMYANGVYKAQISYEAGNLISGRRSRVLGAVSGGAAGTTIGTVAGGIAGEQIGMDPRESGSYGALMGAALGLVFGGRKIAPNMIARDAGGLPVLGRVKNGANGISGLLQTQWKPLMRAGEMATEAPFRMMMFVNEFMESGSVLQASDKLIQHMGDWGALSAFERRVMRRAVPFYSWTKIATMNTARNFIENPGRLNKPMTFFRDWNTSFGSDPEDIPDFYDDRLVMLANPDSPVIGRFMPEGQSVISGFGLPIEDTSNIMSGILPGSTNIYDEKSELIRSIGSRTDFFPTTLLEAAIGHDAFTDRDINPQTEIGYFGRGARWEGAPDWMKFLVGYREGKFGANDTVNPTFAWAMGKGPLSRFQDVCKKVFAMNDEERAKVNYYTLARVLLGPNVYNVDPKTNKYYKNEGRIRAMATILKTAGSGEFRESWRSYVDGSSKRKKKSPPGGL